MERCRIREVRRRLIGTLSNGYRQRVGLADALLHQPPLLILDEPTAGLDPLQIRETLNTIRELGDGHTVLLSTHILSEVEAVCGRVIIISQGRIGFDEQMSKLGDDTSIIMVEAKGPVDAVTQSLRSIAGVAQVTAHPTADGWTGYDLNLQNDRDLREEVYQTFTKQPSWSLRRLDLRRRKLDDIFSDVALGAGRRRVAPIE
jgi:ABC-2 type transport system ATP-binding protein